MYKALHTQVVRALSHYDSAYGIEDLARSRQVFFLLFLLFGFNDFSYVRLLGPGLFKPPALSPAWWWGAVPPPWFFVSLGIVNFLSVAALLLGWQLRWATFVFCGSYIIGHSFYYSFGQVDHYYLFIPLFPLIGLLGGWGRPGRWTLSAGGVYFVMAFALGLAFLTAALPKLLTGWLSWQDQQVRYVIVNYTYGIPQSHTGHWILSTLKNKAAWEALDWLTVAFEGSVIAFVARPRWFWLGLALCCLFHGIVFVVLGINFFHIFIVYAALLPWTRMANRLKGALRLNFLPLTTKK